MPKRTAEKNIIHSRFVLMIILIAIPFLGLGLWSKFTISNKVVERQKTLLKANRVNIETFFEVIGNSVSVLARVDSVKVNNTQITKDLDIFMEEWQDSGLIGGIVLVDEEGQVDFNSNILGVPDIGMSLADRDYFTWAKNLGKEGDYFVGRAVVSRLGGSKGQIIIPVASPVLKNGKFSGVMVAAVKLDTLNKRFLGLMDISNSTKVYLVNVEGAVIYSNDSLEKVGKNIEELEGNLKNVRYTTKEGIICGGGNITAFSPVDLGDRKWLLIMSSLSNEIDSCLSRRS